MLITLEGYHYAVCVCGGGGGGAILSSFAVSQYVEGRPEYIVQDNVLLNIVLY